MVKRFLLVLLSVLCLATSVLAWDDIGLNFRSTSGYVTDGTDETYVLSSDSYPTTRGGVTFGWVGSCNSANRDSGVDRRLAGINYCANDNTERTFRVDLDSTGDWEIYAAFGDTNSSQFIWFEFIDNVTRFGDCNEGDSFSTNVDNYLDATCTNRSEADWPGNNAALSRTFGSTTFFVVFGPTSGGSGNTTITHLRLVKVASSSAAMATMMMMGQR